MVDGCSDSPGLIVRCEQPFNAEPPLARLRAASITAQSDFYIRCHGPVPQVDPSTYGLTVAGLVKAKLTLSLAALQASAPARTVTAVLQCAGNRRGDLQSVRPTTGDPWAPGAIGNAAWTGIGLADLLHAAGADTAPANHVAFTCADVVDMPEEGRFHYGVSIPMTKALQPEVLLAWAINGDALAPEHGFPLRLVVPGYAGVRSPKWLTGITVQTQPSDNHMQQRDYKLLPFDMTKDTLDWSRGTPIDEMPLNAAICEPAAGAVLPPGRTVVRGYAIVSGRSIARVDVSGDGGQSWVQAELEPPASCWSWTLWRASLDLAAGDRELVVRAWDSAGQTQPERAETVWNCKGYLCTAWHRVPVRVG